MFRAVAVFLTPRYSTGLIIDVVPPTATTNGAMTFQVSITDTASIIVPVALKPYLVGDGEVPWSSIQAAVGCGRYPQARVFLNPDATEETAAVIDILPQVVDAEIGNISVSSREIIT